VGVEDYPGDGTIGTGGTGPIPKYVDSGYAISYRDGTVEFGSTIDSVATPVRANFAYYKEIKNVTAQVLDYVGFDNGYQFKAVSETTWPGSHDKRWVTRTNSQMPNILYHTYLGTTKVIPSTLVSSPYGLAVSQSFTSLNAFETKIIDPSKNKIYFIYNGSVGQTGYLTIDGVTFSVSNVLNGSTPTLVWNGTMMSIDGVITNIATTYNFKVKYYGILCFSLYDFIQ